MNDDGHLRRVYELKPDAYPLVEPLFTATDQHLALQAALARAAPGLVYVDDIDEPRSAFAWTQRRIFLGGSPYNEAFDDDLRILFAERLAPLTSPHGKPVFTIHYGTAGWEGCIDAIVANEKHLSSGVRHYYEHRGDCQDAPEVPSPIDFSIRQFDRDLLGQEQLQNLDALTEEMCSERPSVQDFLAHSFGICLLHGEELVGWCLSEYDHKDRCEVGSEIVEGYRRRGLGTMLTKAFVEKALSRGVSRIG